MNRNILTEMEEIFRRLIENVNDDNKHRIVDIKRHIEADDGLDEPVSHFVRRALKANFKNNFQFISMYEFEENRYLLFDKKYQDIIEKKSFHSEEENSVIFQGAGMLAIASGILPIKDGITSYEIIDKCLGIDSDEDIDEKGKKNISFLFSRIRYFFRDYCVVCDNASKANYEEDLIRLICFMQIDQCSIDDKSKKNLNDLLSLESSRSIAGNILNSILSPLEEYGFLQIYQCFEYLFILNNIFILKNEHDNVDYKVLVDIVLDHKFKLSEKENLTLVLRNNTSKEMLQDLFNDFYSTGDENEQINYDLIAENIYKIRCNIAHLRYQQDKLEVNDWKSLLAHLTSVLYSIYEKRDKEIIEINEYKNTWTEISFGK